MRYRRKIDDKKLLQMLQEGKNQKAVAKIFGVSEAAVSKRVWKLKSPPIQVPESLQKLAPKEQQFVLEKSTGKTATEAAFQSYDVSSRKSAKEIGSQLMAKPAIKVALQDVLEMQIPQEHRVKRLREWIDHHDPNASLKALDMTFKLSGDYAPEKHLSVQMTYADYIRQKYAIRDEMIKLKRELEELCGKQIGAADDPGQIIDGQCLPEGQCIPEAHEAPKSNEAPVTPPGGSKAIPE